ncbi:DMT family transporter [Frankia sp. Ag45/Mut15]|uniref:DMT family transporter n=1 Tax=Frankia umida TaxID=573489 RepID=A0ABT0K4W0_9ACTN|nr:DMT family transporter [Frankia umida]MCK9878358.1 DMT family transporter [Frankia umida]
MPTFVPLSLLAAFLLASSAAVQQRAAARSHYVADDDARAVVPGPGHFLDLVTRPLWLVGWLLNLAGFLMQAAALHLGTLTQVQPLMVTQLVFALPLALVGTRLRMARTAWWAIAAICAGLALLLAVQDHPPAHAPLDRTRMVIATAAIAVAVVTLVGVSYARRPAARAALLGTAAGLLYALSALLLKETTDVTLTNGLHATVTRWPAYALCGVTLTSLWLGQAAFAVGPLAAAITAMTITNPTAAYALGLSVFDVPTPRQPGVTAGVAVAAGLVISGVYLLSRPAALPRPRRTAPRQPPAQRLPNRPPRPPRLPNPPPGPPC